MSTALNLRQAAAMAAMLVLGTIAFGGDALADRGGHRRSHGGAHFAAPHHRPHYGHPHHHRHRHFFGSAVIAAPLVVPAYRYYYAPPPPAYASGYWHYCESAGAYYPYVADCPEGWRLVPAR
jgi:hypothetical protein